MGELITSFLSSMTEVVTGIIGTIKDGFVSFIYVDPSAQTLIVSDIAKFVFIMAGVGVAMGLVGMVMAIIRKRRA